MGKEKLLTAALSALNEVVQIAPGEDVLILNDIHCRFVADAFRNAAETKKCKTVSFLINEKDRPLSGIPEGLVELLKGKTVVLNILKAFPEEINFRIKWLFKIEENNKIKCAHMPGITKAMMTEGPMNIDYKDMRKNAAALIYKLKDADHLHITTKAGTDLILGIKDRIFTDDVLIKPGKMSNLPCGEIYCAPEETKADGIDCLRCQHRRHRASENSFKSSYVKNGKITRFESDDKKLVDRIKELSSVDEEARVIGELGIGLNPGARITGNMLEDEKAIHTAHIAFGNNEDFPGGGKNYSKIHRDFLFHKPTVEIFYKIIQTN